MENSTSSQSTQLWTSHYSTIKPSCFTCKQQQIANHEYKFCSTKLKPSIILDSWGRKVAFTFEDIYACNVYHWTLFQGQGKVNRDNKPKTY